MLEIVARQGTRSAETPTIFKMEVIIAVWEYHRSVEINQMCVIVCVSLDRAYPVWVVADTAGGTVITDV